MPNLDFLSELFGNSFLKEGLLPIKTIIVASPKPQKNLMHDEGDPPPSTPHLNAFPNLVFDTLANVGKTKNNTLLGERCRGDVSPLSVDGNGVMPNGPHEGGFFANGLGPKLETSRTYSSPKSSLATC